MSKWLNIRGVRHYDVMIEVEDDYTSELAASDVTDEFNLDEVTDITLVPDEDVERYLRHCTDTMDL